MQPLPNYFGHFFVYVVKFKAHSLCPLLQKMPRQQLIENRIVKCDHLFFVATGHHNSRRHQRDECKNVIRPISLT